MNRISKVGTVVIISLIFGILLFEIHKEVIELKDLGNTKGSCTVIHEYIERK